MPRKKSGWIVGADHFLQWALRRARQLRNAVDWKFTRRRFVLPEALGRIPGRSKGAGSLDVEIRFQDLAPSDQVKALDNVKLFRVRRSESVHLIFRKSLQRARKKRRLPRLVRRKRRFPNLKRIKDQQIR